ncbi:MAG: hypothetical protein ACOYXN_02845 [Acidobacteriota bacterium]
MTEDHEIQATIALLNILDVVKGMKDLQSFYEGKGWNAEVDWYSHNSYLLLQSVRELRDLLGLEVFKDL